MSKTKKRLAEEYYKDGMAKLNLCDYKGAIADFTEAIKLNPEHFWAHYERGLARKRLGDYIGAREDFSKIAYKTA